MKLDEKYEKQIAMGRISRDEAERFQRQEAEDKSNGVRPGMRWLSASREKRDRPKC